MNRKFIKERIRCQGSAKDWCNYSGSRTGFYQQNHASLQHRHGCGIIALSENREPSMTVHEARWQTIASYTALNHKPRFAVFYYPAAPELSLPETVGLSPQTDERAATHWHPLEDTATIHASHPRSTAGTSLQALTARQMAALKLLAGGKADFHATVQAGANLSTMSALIKSGLAKTTQKDGVKFWEITEAGLAKLRSEI